METNAVVTIASNSLSSQEKSDLLSTHTWYDSRQKEGSECRVLFETVVMVQMLRKIENQCMYWRHGCAETSR